MPSSEVSDAVTAVDRPPLRGTLIDRNLLRKNDPAALQVLSRLCRKICGGLAYRYGVSRYADDISQNVLIAFLHTNATPRPDEQGIPVEAFLLKAGRRAALTCMRATKRVRGLREGETFDDLVERDTSDAEPDYAPTEGPVAADSSAQQPRRPAEREKTERKRRRRPRRSATPSEKPAAATERNEALTPAVANGVPMPRLVVRGKVRGDALRAARLHWGLTQHRMATALGIGLRVLRNLEYNDDAYAPDELVPRITRLATRMQKFGYSGYSDAVFRAKLRTWTDRLGLDPDDYLGLARHLQLDRSTTWRWFKKPGCHPRRDRMEAFDAYVDAAAERQRVMLEAIVGHPSSSQHSDARVSAP